MMISVIMPVYNEKIYELNDSIKSILNQSYQNFEFIIVDDNPQSIIIKEYLLNISNKYNKIKVYFNKQNMGAMVTANRAISKAKGIFIARMDADDIAYPNRLKCQLNFCLKYKLNFSSCNFSFVKNGVKQNFVYNKTLHNRKKLEHLLYYANPATGPTLFFNRKIVKSIGGYRNILAEDYDLAVRMIVHNYTVGYLSKPLVYKRYRSDGLSETNSLSTFIVLYLIKNYAKRYNFNKIMSEKSIHKYVKLIRSENIENYHKFIIACHKCEQNKTFINLLKKYFWAFSTSFLFKRNLIVFRNKRIHLIRKFIYDKIV